MPQRYDKLKLLRAAGIITTELSDALSTLSMPLQKEVGDILETQNPAPPPYNGTFVKVPESKPSPLKDKCSTTDSKLVKYLMASYLYYETDYSVMTDHEYDRLCLELDADFESLTHWARKIVSRESLRAGTGFDLCGKIPGGIRGQALYWKHSQENS